MQFTIHNPQFTISYSHGHLQFTMSSNTNFPTVYPHQHTDTRKFENASNALNSAEQSRWWAEMAGGTMDRAFCRKWNIRSKDKIKIEYWRMTKMRKKINFFPSFLYNTDHKREFCSIRISLLPFDFLMYYLFANMRVCTNSFVNAN